MAGRPRLLTRPPQLHRALERPRLREAAGVAPVVVVTGATGSGTTTAAAQIAGLPDARVAWCRLAAGYDRAADVVGMVAGSIDSEGDRTASTGGRVIDLADRLLDLIGNGPLVVVIDDNHLASDGDLDRLIAECVGLLPVDARFVVAGAARPAGLIGLVPAGDLAIIDAGDLAFTDAEATELFSRHGAAEGRALEWNRELHGWAQGVAAGASAPSSPPSDHLTAMLERLTADDPVAAGVLDVAATVPYVTPGLLAAAGVDVSTPELDTIVQRTPLLADNGGFVRLAEVAAVAHRAALDAERSAEIGEAVGRALAADDPTTAIDIFLAAGEHDAAADVLADHLSEIGVERALTWLYRLPPELRRRFPPVLAAGQATVEVDSALAAAELRVDAATSDRARREALFALGSVERHRGELAAAAGAFESALRAAGDDERFAVRVTIELATTRWLLGDLVGSRSALAESPAGSEAEWLIAQLEVVEDVGGESRRDSVAPMVNVTRDDDALTLAATALRALAAGDTAAAMQAAEAAYGLAAEQGGEALCAAGPVLAWCLLRLGRVDEALVITDEFERRLGPRHELGRVHGAIVRECASRDGDDQGTHERDVRRLRDVRARGYATIERLAETVLDATPDSSAVVQSDAAVLVEVLGVHRAVVGPRQVGRGDWKSKKAFEVLTVLAQYGPRGARREQVIEAVWPEREPDKGRTLLRTALSEIRRVLEPDRPAGEASSFLTSSDDIVRLDGELDLDRVEARLDREPEVGFQRLVAGIAPEVVQAGWADELVGRAERLTMLAAAQVTADADTDTELRVAAMEALIAAEPWQRDHYDALAALHRSAGHEPAAADVERRWFADD